MKYILYNVVKTLGRPVYKILYRPRYYNVDNIPNEGPVVLAGNHTNNLDAAMMVGSPNRMVHMIAKKELFKSKLGNWFFRSMGCIPVDRSIHDEKCKSEALEHLKNGGAIGLFPEGTVNKTKGTDHEEYLLPFKYGAVSFAKKTAAYLVPFAINGEYKLFRKSIKITYGKPYKVTKDLEPENEILRNKVYKLMKEGDKEYEQRDKRSKRKNNRIPMV